MRKQSETLGVVVVVKQAGNSRLRNQKFIWLLLMLVHTLRNVLTLHHVNVSNDVHYNLTEHFFP